VQSTRPPVCAAGMLANGEISTKCQRSCERGLPMVVQSGSNAGSSRAPRAPALADGGNRRAKASPVPAHPERCCVVQAPPNAMLLKCSACRITQARSQAGHTHAKLQCNLLRLILALKSPQRLGPRQVGLPVVWATDAVLTSRSKCTHVTCGAGLGNQCPLCRVQRPARLRPRTPLPRPGVLHCWVWQDETQT